MQEETRCTEKRGSRMRREAGYRERERERERKRARERKVAEEDTSRKASAEPHPPTKKRTRGARRHNGPEACEDGRYLVNSISISRARGDH